MKVTLWGTRGSLAAPGPETTAYGGNTSCVEVRGADGTVLVLDAGTGIRRLGAALPPGSAGIVAIYDRAKASTVDATLTSAVRKSVAQVDGGGAKKLKAALAEAQAGMGG